MKKLILLLSLGYCYADNTDLFNQFYQVGKKNQFNLKLNTNSTIDSYGHANAFQDSVASTANAGNANAQSMYNNTYGDKANPNYLYNAGTQDIANCLTKSDPRCTTLNKYGDKGTQNQLQAYSQGVSAKYYISVKPDPEDSSCSTITRKVPINASTVSCIASLHTQTSCNSTISISLSSNECDEQKGECAIYKSNPDCTLTKPYVPGACLQYTYNANFGSCRVGVYTCTMPSTLHTPGCDGSHGRDYACGTCTGQDSGDHDGCWNQSCTKSTPPQLAVYSCKTSSYSDGCSGFKK